MVNKLKQRVFGHASSVCKSYPNGLHYVHASFEVCYTAADRAPRVRSLFIAPRDFAKFPNQYKVFVTQMICIDNGFGGLVAVNNKQYAPFSCFVNVASGKVYRKIGRGRHTRNLSGANWENSGQMETVILEAVRAAVQQHDAWLQPFGY
jgi:hypothetical protein